MRERSKMKLEDIRLRARSQALYAAIAAILLPIAGIVCIAMLSATLSVPNLVLLGMPFAFATASFVFVFLGKKREERRLIASTQEGQELARLADSFSRVRPTMASGEPNTRDAKPQTTSSAH